jgi:hypothetical protein
MWVLRLGDHHALNYLLRLRRFALRIEEDYRRGVLSEVLSEVLKWEKVKKKASFEGRPLALIPIKDIDVPMTRWLLPTRRSR